MLKIIKVFFPIIVSIISAHLLRTKPYFDIEFNYKPIFIFLAFLNIVFVAIAIYDVFKIKLVKSLSLILSIISIVLLIYILQLYFDVADVFFLIISLNLLIYVSIVLHIVFF